MRLCMKINGENFIDACERLLLLMIFEQEKRNLRFEKLKIDRKILDTKNLMLSQKFT